MIEIPQRHISIEATMAQFPDFVWAREGLIYTATFTKVSGQRFELATSRADNGVYESFFMLDTIYELQAIRFLANHLPHWLERASPCVACLDD